MPEPSRENPSIINDTGLPTREISAISRTLPSFIPIAPSQRGIMPFILPRSISRLCAASQLKALASIISPFAAASSSSVSDDSIRQFLGVVISEPSG